MCFLPYKIKLLTLSVVPEAFLLVLSRVPRQRRVKEFNFNIAELKFDCVATGKAKEPHRSHTEPKARPKEQYKQWNKLVEQEDKDQSNISLPILDSSVTRWPWLCLCFVKTELFTSAYSLRAKSGFEFKMDDPERWKGVYFGTAAPDEAQWPVNYAWLAQKARNSPLSRG